MEEMMKIERLDKVYIISSNYYNNIPKHKLEAHFNSLSPLRLTQLAFEVYDTRGNILKHRVCSVFKYL